MFLFWGLTMRWRLRALIVTLALALVGAGPVPFGSMVGEVQAQERQRPNLLDVFRRKPRAQPRRATRRAAPKRSVTRRAAPKRRATRKAAPRRVTKRRTSRPAKKRVVRRAAPAAAAAASAPSVADTEKMENAKTVLVVGDFLADGLADGLEDAFADEAGIRIVNAANSASGVVRDDYYDWPKNAAELIEQHEPSVIALQIGANDRQPIKEGGRTIDRKTEEWTTAYKARLSELAEVLTAKGTPLVWVGTPSFRQRSLMADMATFNALYASAAEQANAAFVDIWDGFVDRNGAYVRTGPDINGQNVRLRGKDGINLSRAGKRKMAFFAEKDIRRFLGDAPIPGSINAEIAGLPPLGDDLLEAPLQPRMLPPVSLDASSLVGGEALLGESAVTVAPAAPRANPGLVTPDEGPPAGRADNFAWPASG